MGWIIVYLVCCLFIPALYVSMSVAHDNKVEMRCGEDVWAALFFCLFWPLAILLSIYARLAKSYRESMRSSAENVIHTYIKKANRDDRASIIAAPEHCLKLVLRAYRKKYIKLETMHAEMIREELLHRNMERNLLK
jgi:hypothetical protein